MLEQPGIYIEIPSPRCWTAFGNLRWRLALADIAQNLPRAREASLDQSREEAFAVFVSNLTEQYQKQGRVAVSKQAFAVPSLPGQPGS